MTQIFTTCNEAYLPGLVALHNSYLRNSADGFEFVAIIEGTQELADHITNDLGIQVILNPEFPATEYPVSFRYPEPWPLSWLRLLVPGLATGDKSVYIDTDALILQSLQPLIDLDMGNKPVAATHCNSRRELDFSGGDGDHGPMSSFYIFNHKAWFEKRILERVVEAMKGPVTFYTLSQGALQYVVGNDWHVLPWSYQPHAGHDTYFRHPKNEAYVLHFMGTNPWDEFKPGVVVTEHKLKLRELWQTYA